MRLIPQHLPPNPLVSMSFSRLHNSLFHQHVGYIAYIVAGYIDTCS